MKRILCSLLTLFVLLPALAGAGFSKETFVDRQGDTIRYRLLTPERLNHGEKYPLVIFLHGAGERGNDNEKQQPNVAKSGKP